MTSKRQGAVLVETLLLVTYVMVPLFLAHLAIVRQTGKRLREVETKRLKYDGVVRWRSGETE